MDISSTFCLDRKIKIKIRKGKGHLMREKKKVLNNQFIEI
jgi:hypothetical protein